MNSNSDRKLISSRDIKILIPAFLSLIIACVLNLNHKRPELVLSKQDTALNINNKFLSILSGGHKRLITDLLWIQTLIESDTEHYIKKDLNSWLFLRFNSISMLDPYFYQNYTYGGQFLSIVKDDLAGAQVIYEKGINYFPEDYSLNFHAGFMYYYELGDYVNGLKYLSKVASHPRAPNYIGSIINKLKHEVTGDLRSTYELVYYHFQTTTDEKLKLRLFQDLYSIKAEIDLNCLNKRLGHCTYKDLEGNSYVKLGDTYFAVKKFSFYKIKKREEN